jgi:hypothetical protein
MKPMQIEFKEFVTSGRYGPLSCNLKKEAVLQVMGQPINWHMRSGMFVKEPVEDPMASSGWSYGYLSISFDDDGRAQGLALQTKEPREKIPDFCIGYWPASAPSVSEVQEYLRKEGIVFRELPDRPLGFSIVIGAHALVRTGDDLRVNLVSYHRDADYVTQLIA